MASPSASVTRPLPPCARLRGIGKVGSIPAVRMAAMSSRSSIFYLFDEFERAGTDRTLAHLARWQVAWIDRREPGSEQRDEGRLWAPQLECHLVIAVVVTSSRLRYQALRGLIRSVSLVLPRSRSQVHFTSLAVNGLPSCHLTPSCNLKVSCLPSSSQVQPMARSGTIDRMLFCFTCWSYMTRLLKTPITGRTA